MNTLRRFNFLWLFVGLLLFLLALPITQHSNQQIALVIEGGFTSLLLLGIWSLRPFHRWFPWAVSLVIADLLALAIYLWHGEIFWSVVNILTSLSFCLISIVLTMQFILQHHRIDANHLLGALSVYLLLGVIWALLYSLLRLAAPDALANVTAVPGQADEIGELLYYSFTTLTTLGYGDIVPTSPLARSLAILEVVIGQVFLAVLIATVVARLVGSDPGKKP